ncbi:Polymerase beta nucleotidyltransferase domain-containing protein [Candidatus Magnetomoraceae bacterium gMMP-15]
MNKNIPLIIERLKTISPYKIIFFDSHAYGSPNKNSDIDLLIVTNDNFFPKNYQEKSNIYLKISKLLTDFKTKFSIDLIVYTKPMYERFKELGSLFSKEIFQKGIVLY